MLPPDGPPVVIDWGGVSIGDARKDLAWSLLLVGAHDGLLRDAILDEYMRQGGDQIEGFEYFEVLAGLIRLLFLVDSYDLLAGRLRQREDSDWELAKMTEHIEDTHQMLKDRTGIVISEVDDMVTVLPDSAYAKVVPNPKEIVSQASPEANSL